MDILKIVIKLAKVLSWPATLTLILFYIHKNYGESIAALLAGRSRDREFRDLLLSAGVKSEDVDNYREKIMQVATEPDPDRRLEIAKEMLAAEADVKER